MQQSPRDYVVFTEGMGASIKPSIGTVAQTKAMTGGGAGMGIQALRNSQLENEKKKEQVSNVSQLLSHVLKDIQSQGKSAENAPILMSAVEVKGQSKSLVENDWIVDFKYDNVVHGITILGDGIEIGTTGIRTPYYVIAHSFGSTSSFQKVPKTLLMQQTTDVGLITAISKKIPGNWSCGH